MKKKNRVLIVGAKSIESLDSKTKARLQSEYGFRLFVSSPTKIYRYTSEDDVEILSGDLNSYEDLLHAAKDCRAVVISYKSYPKDDFKPSEVANIERVVKEAGITNILFAKEDGSPLQNSDYCHKFSMWG
ncbi:MAG: NAD(P)H-binding protein [Rikenellaceae bacterium]